MDGTKIRSSEDVWSVDVGDGRLFFLPSFLSSFLHVLGLYATLFLADDRLATWVSLHLFFGLVKSRYLFLLALSRRIYIIFNHRNDIVLHI